MRWIRHFVPCAKFQSVTGSSAIKAMKIPTSVKQVDGQKKNLRPVQVGKLLDYFKYADYHWVIPRMILAKEQMAVMYNDGVSLDNADNLQELNTIPTMMDQARRFRNCHAERAKKLRDKAKKEACKAKRGKSGGPSTL